MSATRPRQRAVMIATESFATEVGGHQMVVVAGRTRVSADSDLYAMFPQHFESVSEGMEYVTESATENPGETRTRGTTAARRGPAAKED